MQDRIELSNPSKLGRDVSSTGAGDYPFTEQSSMEDRSLPGILRTSLTPSGQHELSNNCDTVQLALSNLVRVQEESVQASRRLLEAFESSRKL